MDFFSQQSVDINSCCYFHSVMELIVGISDFGIISVCVKCAPIVVRLSNISLHSYSDDTHASFWRQLPVLVDWRRNCPVCHSFLVADFHWRQSPDRTGSIPCHRGLRLRCFYIKNSFQKPQGYYSRYDIIFIKITIRVCFIFASIICRRSMS